MRRWSTWPLLLGGLALVVLGALSAWRWLDSRRPREVPILMYHRVAEVENSAWCVPSDIFERQMQFLRQQGYTSILPADLAAHQRWGSPLPKRPIIITFNDGFRDCLTTAEPILRQYGLRAIVFLITDDNGHAPEERRQFEGTDCLTWAEVHQARQRGTLAFGAHAHPHQNLSAAHNPLELTKASRKQIIRYGRFIPDAFSYPGGQYNERAIEAVRQAGFGTAVGCVNAVARTGRELNLLALPRVSVMGGRHRYQVARVPEEETDGEVIFRVRHEGIPIEVTPCLKSAAGASWLPPQVLKNGTEAEWRWTQAGNDQTLQLELWDRCRILPLYP